MLAQRLTAQQIASPTATTPQQVVARMGAMQAQDYLGALWAVALRMKGAVSEASVERAICDGDVVRIHALRGTWQLVAPDDVRWMLALVGPAVYRSAAARHRALGLDDRGFARFERVVARAMRGGAHLTRDEIRRVLAGERIACAGPRLMHLLWGAELHGVLCNGVRRGKQWTYALLDERVPAGARAMARDEAIVELATRYVRSRGPATPADFAWWSGLSLTEARRGFAEVRAEPPRARRATGVHLLPAFDEYLVAYRDRDAMLDPRIARRYNPGGGILAPTVVVDGRVVGMWSRKLARTQVVVAVQPFERRARLDVAAAATRYAAFLGKPLATAKP